MRVTWKDAVTTLVTGGVVALYAAFLLEANLLLVSGPRAVAGAVLVLGLIGYLVVRDGQEYVSAGPIAKNAIAMAKVWAGAALFFGIITMITGSETTLAALIGTTVGWCVVTTLRHALTRPVRTMDDELLRMIEQENKRVTV
jgi:hypothetical protein